MIRRDGKTEAMWAYGTAARKSVASSKTVMLTEGRVGA